MLIIHVNVFSLEYKRNKETLSRPNTMNSLARNCFQTKSTTFVVISHKVTMVLNKLQPFNDITTI